MGNRAAGSEAKSTLVVTVSVNNIDEAGMVIMTARQPQVGKSVRASVEDPDGDASGVTWQWASLAATGDGTTTTCPEAGAGGWEDIAMAMSASYTPAGGADGDIGNCLRATATYTDPAKEDDADTADVDESRANPAIGVTDRPVEDKPAANSAPTFPDNEMPDGADPIEMDVEEGTEGMILTVTASVDDGDLLIYTLGGDDAGSFDIVPMSDGEGEISVGKGTTLDYEGKQVYSFMAIATDPSGADDKVAITINVTDVDEAPVLFTEPPAPAENVAPMFDAETATFMVYENMYAGAAVGMVEATDEGDTLTYSDDSGYFDVDGDGNITTTMMLDHEAMASHTVTVTATDDEGASDTIDVTVNVGDAHPDCVDFNASANDCEALLDSRDELGGALNWSLDHGDLWDGVFVAGPEGSERVVILWLRDMGLDGTVPAALGRLSALTVLNLHSNMLSGDIPDLSGASMLEELYLANNADYDEVDGEKVKVAGSGLTGGIPMWLNGMANMTELWLWGNSLSGSVPDLSGMTSLDKLKLANNDLTGNINAMYLPQNVSWLIIDRNGFDGSIPDLSMLTSLRLLWLHSNDLTGNLPDGTNFPASLDDLNVRDNGLTGDIPDLSNLDNLTRLRLHNNSLSGMVPGTLGGLESLERLWLHNEVAIVDSATTPSPASRSDSRMPGRHADAPVPQREHVR